MSAEARLKGIRMTYGHEIPGVKQSDLKYLLDLVDKQREALQQIYDGDFNRACNDICAEGLGYIPKAGDQ